MLHPYKHHYLKTLLIGGEVGWYEACFLWKTEEGSFLEEMTFDVDVSQQLKKCIRKEVCSVCRSFETDLKMVTILLLLSVLFVSGELLVKLLESIITGNSQLKENYVEMWLKKDNHNMTDDAELSPYALLTGALAACSKESNLNITAPQKMEALSGSCLQIPCKFMTGKEQDFTGQNVGVWIKHDPRFRMFPQNVIFNGSWTENVYQVKIIGDLSQKNCTSVFHSLKKNYTDKFFFRVETNLFNATATCHPLQINITGKTDFYFQSTKQILFAQHLSSGVPYSCWGLRTEDVTLC